jgi:hypothetical protein
VRTVGFAANLERPVLGRHRFRHGISLSCRILL